jgi:predicted Zn finger-like uncharacterized protein
MRVTCSNCEARLQLDDSKIPPHSFKVKCPKCQTPIAIRSAAQGAEANPMPLPPEMTPPSPAVSPFERPVPAARFQPGDAPARNVADQASPANLSEVAKMLADALRQNADPKPAAHKTRPAWDRRKALVCTEEPCRDAIAKGLATQDYDVFVAANTSEALGRMREDRIDVLILDPNFDQVEQGFAFVMREVKLMRPAERRRMFLTSLTSSARTMDLHTAFLNNANLVVNPADVDRLPEALEISIRHYNELYRDFNRALDVAGI